MNLTGQQRYRIGFTGVLILQVEEEGYAMWPYSRNVTLGREWRDASPSDFLPEPPKGLTIDEEA